jgi:hypothetical protein
MRRVLIADDSASNRELLRTMLAHEGWTVEEARDGLTAVEMATARPPELILLDIQMPGLDGYETLRRLRAGAGAGGGGHLCRDGFGDGGRRAAGAGGGLYGIFDQAFNAPDAAGSAILRGMSKYALFVAVLVLCGCQSLYYKAQETLGNEKRDILIDRVKKAGRISRRPKSSTRRRWRRFRR